MPKLIIFAPNVGSGGGLVLLRELLYANNTKQPLVAIVDSRGKPQIEVDKVQGQIIWAKASLLGRLRAEWQLQRLGNSEDIVLCFHNLPPLLSNSAQLVCYVHSVFALENAFREQTLGWERFRYAMERFIAAGLKRRVARYVVQTLLMQDRLARWFGDNPPPIDILPFSTLLPTLPEPAGSREFEGFPNELINQRFDFFYPSEGSQHKNHMRLFAAWCLLADAGHFPRLAVTLHPGHDADLVHALQSAINSSGLLIENLGRLEHSEVMAHYRAAGALIYPSFVESFGLPLIEAARLQLPILAPELDYVRQVCEPSQTFDPFSPRSIAEAVLRHRGIAPTSTPHITAEDFLATLRIRSGFVEL
jgi:glycosyltransferase involved in cell wall biosynthesis